jgi:hypothetical protein
LRLVPVDDGGTLTQPEGANLKAQLGPPKITALTSASDHSLEVPLQLLLFDETNGAEITSPTFRGGLPGFPPADQLNHKPRTHRIS